MFQAGLYDRGSYYTAPAWRKFASAAKMVPATI